MASAPPTSRTWGQAIKHPLVLAVIAAGLTLLTNTCTTYLGQSFLERVEDQKNRRDVVLELMRSTNRDEMLERLGILHESGLLEDRDEKLRNAVSGSRLQRLPIPVACVDLSVLPAEPESELLASDDARVASSLLAAKVLELRAYARTLRAMLQVCGNAGPPDVRSDQNGASPPAR